ncbi:MAG: hypothetical protein V3V01_14110 [Acidimicrobiales bacterium]
MNRSRLITSALSAGLFLSACGGAGGEASTASPAAAAANADAAAQAEANIKTLESTGNVRTTEVLNLSDGSKSTLEQAVTGDRPVLLWYWAPH